MKPAPNQTVTREAKQLELLQRVERTLRWAEGFDVLATAVERLSLPVMDLDDVRQHVAARLRTDAAAARADVERMAQRLRDIQAADAAATAWHRRRQ